MPNINESEEDVFADDDDAGAFVFSDDVMDCEKIKSFLAAAGDANYVPIPIEDEGPYPEVEETGLTLLHWAAWYKQTETVKALIQFGAKVEVKDVKGKTPLDLATQRGADKDLVALLSSKNNRKSLRLFG